MAINTSKGKIRNDDLDLFRALAVLLVVVYHYFASIFPRGYIGVDIFIVTSGYLIQGVLSSGPISTGRIKKFLLDRYSRLIPPVVPVLAFLLLFGYLYFSPREYEELTGNVKHFFSLNLNYKYSENSGYFSTSERENPLLHFWSLVLEIQFYIVYLILYSLEGTLAKKLRQYSVIPLMLVALVSLAMHFQIPSLEGYYVFESRFWEFLCGVILKRIEGGGVIKHVRGTISRYRGIIRIALILLLFFSASPLFPMGDSYSKGFIIIPVMLAILFLMAFGEQKHTMMGARIFSPLAYMGRSCYEIYIWHKPIIALLWILAPHSPSYSTRMFGLLASLALSTVQFEFFKRFRISSFCNIFLCTLILPVVIGASQGVGLPYGNLAGFKPHPDTFSPRRSDLDVQSCVEFFGAGYGGNCALSSSKVGELVNLVFLGDSHADALSSGAEALGLEYLSIGKNGCPPILGADRKVDGINMGCNYTYRLIFSKFAQLPFSASTLIYSARFGVYENPKFKSEIVLKEEGCDKDQGAKNRNEYLKDLDANCTFNKLLGTLDLLSRQFKNVYVVLPIPELSFDPKLCATRPLALGTFTCLGSERQKYLDDRKLFTDLLIEAAAPFDNISVYDPLEMMCGKTNCRVKIGEEILYRDADHLSNHGAKILLSDILKIRQ